jgi:hypothetical protein
MTNPEELANQRMNGRTTNENKRTLCVFASEPLGVVDDLLEVGGVYQLIENLDPLICREIVDYAKFDDDNADALEALKCEKIAYFHHEEKVATKYRKKASQKQEKTLAKKLGGKVTPGSGAFGFHKGDVKTSDYLVEAKFTDKQEYRLTLKTWNKIENEASDINKTALMEVMLDQDGEPINLILISPMDLFDKANLDEDTFLEQFFSEPIISKAKSILLKKAPIATHIENVTYNYEGKMPAFLIKIEDTVLIGIETNNFIRIIK